MKAQRGLTWTAVLALIVAVAILALAAVPNLAATIQNNRDTAQISVLLASLQLARRTAMQSGSDISVVACRGATSQTCIGNAWSAGWSVRYVNPPPGSVDLIRSYPALTAGNQLSNTAGVRIVFHPNGMTKLAAPATFTLCDSRGTREARAVRLPINGLAEVSPTPGQNLDGTRLVCSAAN